MARVSIEQLQEVFPTDYTSELVPFINIANRLVNAKLVGKGLSEDQLYDIELMLSAHFANALDPRVSKESIAGEYSATYQGKWEMFLKSTTYGQTALVIDESNTLSKLGLKATNLIVFTTPDHGSYSDLDDFRIDFI